MNLVKSGRFNLRLWSEYLSESFLSLEASPLDMGTHVYVTVSGSRKGHINVAKVDVQGKPHVVRRTSALTRYDDGGLLVSLQIHGTCIVKQDERSALLKPGDIASYSSSQPYELVFPSGSHSQVVLQVPWEALHQDALRINTAVRIDGSSGLGQSASALLGTFPHTIRDVEIPEAEFLTNSGLRILSRSLQIQDRKQLPTPILEQAKEFIYSTIDNVDLGPTMIANSVHISVAHLHRIFRSSGTTVMAFVQDNRLRNAALDLRDSSLNYLSVTEIAYMWGFRDPAHFSRAFSARYRKSPSQWRKSFQEETH